MVARALDALATRAPAALAALDRRASGIEAGAGLAMITAGAWLVWSLGVALIVAGSIILAAAAWPTVPRGTR